MLWKSIPFSNYSISEYGDIRNDKTNKIMFPHIHDNKYLRIQLVIKKKAKFYKIHILNAKMWKRNPKKKPLVDHIDNNKLNNHHTNLRYATHSENTLYAIAAGVIDMEYIRSHRSYNKEKNELGQSIINA